MPRDLKNPAPAPPTWRRYFYGLLIALVVGQSLADLVTAEKAIPPSVKSWPRKHPSATPMFSANDRSRWCTVWSLVERGTYQIDEIITRPGWNTIDSIRLNGHAYSSKPPLLATLAAGLYWILNEIFGFSLYDRPYETIYTILIFVNWLPWLCCLGLLAKLVERYAETDASRILVMLTAACGTFVTPFLTTFNNHTVAICAAIATLYPLLRILHDGERGRGWFLLAGFFGAFTTCNELSAAPFGVILFLLLVFRAPRQTLLYFVPASLVPLAAFEYTNYLAVGSWTPAYSLFGTAAYLYPGSYWLAPKGIDKGEKSWVLYLFHCLIGHHGIFSLTPIWLLTVGAWVRVLIWPKKTAAAPLSRITWLSLVLTLAVLLFYLRQTQSYNYGGVTSGLRWTFWLIPFWLLGLVPVVDRFAEQAWFRLLGSLLLAISVFSIRYPHLNPWQHPWLFKLLEAWGVIAYP